MKVNTDQIQMEERAGWTSSKGNQNKWFIDGVWYKEDGLGYEALSEVLISKLLKKSNLNMVVDYAYEPLEKDGILYHGCFSKNFLTPEDDKIVSVERLFQTYLGISAAKAVSDYEETEDRIRYLVDQVEDITGMKHFGIYLKNVITIDALFLNEDRHFHNLAVIQKKDGSFRECPVFDNGAALFSDIRGDYPLNMEWEQCYEKIEAKPFSVDFDRQLDACDLLYGGSRFRAGFTIKDVEKILAGFQGIYEERILDRVLTVMRMQMRKYSYLFSE